jgi:hypothetical protein
MQIYFEFYFINKFLFMFSRIKGIFNSYNTTIRLDLLTMKTVKIKMHKPIIGM